MKSLSILLLVISEFFFQFCQVSNGTDLLLVLPIPQKVLLTHPRPAIFPSHSTSASISDSKIRSTALLHCRPTPFGVAFLPRLFIAKPAAANSPTGLIASVLETLLFWAFYHVSFLILIFIFIGTYLLYIMIKFLTGSWYILTLFFIPSLPTLLPLSLVPFPFAKDLPP